jgi:HK97 family phage prohead protease
MDTPAAAAQVEKKAPQFGMIFLKRVEPPARKDAASASPVATQKDTITFCASDGVTDRAADTINPAGWDLTNYLKNPVILWAHDDCDLPVGKAVNVYMQDGKLFVEVKFTSAEEYDFGARVETLVRGGFLNAVSVRFAPSEYQWNGLGGIDYLKQELLEVSVVPIPCNPRALLDPTKALGAQLQVQKDFTPKAEMREALLAYAKDTMARELGEGVWTPMEHAKAIHGLVEEHAKSSSGAGADATDTDNGEPDDSPKAMTIEAERLGAAARVTIKVSGPVDAKAIGERIQAAFAALTPVPAIAPPAPAAEPKAVSPEEFQTLTTQAVAKAMRLITEKAE